MATLKGDFTKEDPWRIFRIMSEFVDGFEELSDVNNAVTIFGSAKSDPSSKFYKSAETTAALLVEHGYSVITGAGPGIMEAANKGAKKAGGESIGLNILIPTQQKPNKHITRVVEFKYFFCRKVMFLKYAKALVAFPGGFGTLDEFFEAITLVQTNRIDSFPIIVVDKKYWKGLISWMEDTLLSNKMIDKPDLGIFKVVDTPREVVSLINDFYKRNKPSPKRLL
ncbi:MAG: TIGR00730 family Rossman fold protein [Candidatus Omnitrophota bacterium]